MQILQARIIRALFQKAFSDEEGAAYAKYWAPGRHEDIGLFNNWIGANK